MRCLGTDLALQIWPTKCLITTGFCSGHCGLLYGWTLLPNLLCSSHSCYCVHWLQGPCPCRQVAVTGSPSLGEQFTFTALWHGCTLHKALRTITTSNFINLLSYTEEGWMCNTAYHTTSPSQDMDSSSEVITGISKVTSSRSLCLSSLSVSSFCCKLRAFISNIACFFSRSLS